MIDAAGTNEGIFMFKEYEQWATEQLVNCSSL